MEGEMMRLRVSVVLAATMVAGMGVGCGGNDGGRSDAGGSSPNSSSTIVPVSTSTSAVEVAGELLENGDVSHSALDQFFDSSEWADWKQGSSVSEGDVHGRCSEDVPEPCEVGVGNYDSPTTPEDAIAICSAVKSWALARESDVVVEVFGVDEVLIAAGSSDADCEPVG